MGATSCVRGWQLRIVDGNHLLASEKRLSPLRELRGDALPGYSMLVYDPDLAQVVDLMACEDTYEGERAGYRRSAPPSPGVAEGMAVTPAQIRTCGATAYGSRLRCVTRSVPPDKDAQFWASVCRGLRGDQSVTTGAAVTLAAPLEGLPP